MNSIKILRFIGNNLTNQKSTFDVIGQQVSYCRLPHATCHILHSCWAITNTNHFFPIVSPDLHHMILGHGWTSFVVEDLRADSLIVLLMLSELKIASVLKILPCTVLDVSQY